MVTYQAIQDELANLSTLHFFLHNIVITLKSNLNFKTSYYSYGTEYVVDVSLNSDRLWPKQSVNDMEKEKGTFNLLLLVSSQLVQINKHTHMMGQVCIHYEDEVPSGMLYPMDVGSALKRKLGLISIGYINKNTVYKVSNSPRPNFVGLGRRT